MNKFEQGLHLKSEAKLKYLNGEFQVLAPGDFVRCTVSGDLIPLDALRYWNVARQEPYASAAIALKRHRQCADED